MAKQFINGILGGEFGRNYCGPLGLAEAISQNFSASLNQCLDEAAVQTVAKYLEAHPEIRVQFTDLNGSYVGFSNGQLIFIGISKPDQMEEAATGNEPYLSELAKKFGLPMVTDEGKAERIRKRATETLEKLDQEAEAQAQAHFSESLAKAILHGVVKASGGSPPNRSNSPSAN
jgi:hypothetical protein